MIKATFKGILSIVILLILSCSTDNKSADITGKQLHGKVKKVVEKYYSALDRSGEIVKGSLSCQRTSEYDNNRNLIKETCLIMLYTSPQESDDEDDIDRIIRDVMNRQLRYECDNCDNQTYIFKHDSKGNLIEKRTYSLDGSLNSKFTYKYNDNEVLVEECQYMPRWHVRTDKMDFLEYKTKYEYDENRNLTKKNKYDLFGSLEFIQTIKHDSRGNIIEDCNFNKNGDPITKTIYGYDKYNNLISEDFYIKDSICGTEEFKYEYDEEGNIKEKSWLNSDGSLNKSIYTYNDLGYLQEVNSYLGNHPTADKTTEKYEKFDMNGNWIIRTKFSNEILEKVVEREIDYY